jgi:hypothetical protein
MAAVFLRAHERGINRAGSAADHACNGADPLTECAASCTWR